MRKQVKICRYKRDSKSVVVFVKQQCLDLPFGEGRGTVVNSLYLRALYTQVKTVTYGQRQAGNQWFAHSVRARAYG